MSRTIIGPLVMSPIGVLARARTSIARRVSRSWSEPWHRLRAEIGLPPGPDPLFEGQHAPSLVLALFSHLLAEKQPVQLPLQPNDPFYGPVEGYD